MTDGHGLGIAEAAAHFDAKYRADADPWNYASSWYERRKYAVTLASLPRQRYRAVWEPGCSIGELTALLAARADHVDASDTSAVALAAARHRLEHVGGITLTRAALPAGPPGTGYDLVVMSEVLYYLNEADRERSLRVVEQVMPAGDLVVVHWRHHPDDAWASGAAVNAQVAGRPGWRGVARHEEDDFVLDVVTRG